MSQDLQTIAQHALDTARAKGAAQAAVRVGQTRFNQLSYREKKLEKIEASTSSSLNLTLYLDGRYSSNGTSDLRPAAVEAFTEQLVAMTRMLAPDEHRRLPEPELYAGREDRDLHLADPSHPQFSVDARKELAQAVEQAALAASDQVISVTATCYDDHSESLRLHSNGFQGQRRSTSFWSGAQASVKGKGDKKPSDGFWAGARHRGDLPDPARVGQQAVERALAHVGAEKIDSARLPMVIENRAVGRWLGHLLRPLAASALQQKRSCLDDKLGAALCGEHFDLIDDPFVDKGFGSRLYDGEGLAAKRMPIIEKGVLRNYFIDVYYGRKLGMAPTTGSRSNLVFPGGQGDADSLMKGIERGVLVTGFIGGNSSAATGDFSLGIRGHLIEKGKRSRPITEMNITDNLLSFLPKLEAVGADPYPYSAVRAPSLRFKDVPFSGS